ncbi:MAG: hypothetical protein ACRC4W_00550 [Treponemataceae bacterium]
MKKKLSLFLFLAIFISSSFSQLFEFAKHELRIYWGDAAFLNTLSSSFQAPIELRNIYEGVTGSFNFDYTYDINKRISLGFAAGYVLNYRNELFIDPITDRDVLKKVFYHNAYLNFLMKITYFKTEYLKFYGACAVGAGATFSTKSIVSIFPTLQLTAFGTRIGNDEFAFFVDVGVGSTGIICAGLLINIY